MNGEGYQRHSSPVQIGIRRRYLMNDENQYEGEGAKHADEFFMHEGTDLNPKGFKRVWYISPHDTPRIVLFFSCQHRSLFSLHKLTRSFSRKQKKLWRHMEKPAAAS